MSRGFNNFVAKHMHKVHRPAVERDKRSKHLDDAYEKERDEELADVYVPADIAATCTHISINRGDN